MIDGSEKRIGWLSLELQSPLVIERCSNSVLILYRGIRCWLLLELTKEIQRIYKGNTISLLVLQS